VFTGAYWLLVLAAWFEYIRPQDFAALLRSLHVAPVPNIALMVLWVAKGNRAALKDPIILLFLAFLALSAASVTFAVNTYWTYQATKGLFLYLFGFVLPFNAFMNVPALRRFFAIWVAMNSFAAFYAILHAGHGPGAFLGDENDLALALNVAIPYAYFLGQSPKMTRFARLAYRTALGLLIFGVIASDSRGGFVGLVGVIFFIFLYSKRRLRNFLLVGLLVAVLLPFVPSSYYQDMQTITNTQDETRGARIYLWDRAWDMFLDNPIFGVGAGNFGWRVEDYEAKLPEWELYQGRTHGGRVAHSLYFTLIPEFGLVGSMVYAGMVVLVIVRVRRTLKLTKNRVIDDDELVDLFLIARAIIPSLLAFLLSGGFISVLYYPHFWYLIAFATTVESCIRHALDESNRTDGAVRPNSA
jgi:probable O-glycosylation ligase (exosortase A-associated)